MVESIGKLIGMYQSTLKGEALEQFKKLNEEQQLSIAMIKINKAAPKDLGALKNLGEKSTPKSNEGIFPAGQSSSKSSTGFTLERNPLQVSPETPIAPPREHAQHPPENKPATSKTTSYVVQLGESVDGLVKKSLKAQGVENPDEAKLKEATEKFIKENEGLVKTNKKGVKYLNAGATVKLDGEVDTSKNKSAQEVEKEWTQKHAPTEKKSAPSLVRGRGTNAPAGETTTKESGKAETAPSTSRTNPATPLTKKPDAATTPTVKNTSGSTAGPGSPSLDKKPKSEGELDEVKLHKPQSGINLPKLEKEKPHANIEKSLSEYQNSNTFNMGKKFQALHNDVVSELSRKFKNDPIKLANFINNTSKGKCRLEEGKIVGNTIDSDKARRENEPVKLVIQLAKALKDDGIDKPAVKTEAKTMPSSTKAPNPALEEIKKAGIEVKKGGHFVYDKNSKLLSQTYSEGGISKTEKYDANKKLVSLESKYSSGHVLTESYQNGKVAKKVLKTEKSVTTFEGYVDGKPTKSTKIENGQKFTYDTKEKEWVKEEAPKAPAQEITKNMYRKGKLIRKEVSHKDGSVERYEGYNPVPGGKSDFTLKVVTDSKGKKTYYQRDPTDGDYNKIR